MGLSLEDKKLFDRMNKRLDRFDKQGIRNEVVNLAREELLNIYLKESEKGTDLSRSNFNKFSMNTNISDDTLNDLRGLAKALEKAKTSKISYYKKDPTAVGNVRGTFETLKGKKFGVKDFQSYVNFVDDLESAMSTSDITDKLNSDQWARIYGYGKDKKMTTEEINQLIIDNISKYRDGDTFVLYAFKEIDEQYGGDTNNESEN